MTYPLPARTDRGVTALLGRGAAVVAIAFAAVAVAALAGLLDVPFSAGLYTIFAAIFVALAWVLVRLA